MSEIKTPLADAVQGYLADGRVRGHMPGHKGSAAGYLARFGELAAWDLTEADGLDDLHAPVGAIVESERLMATAVGAKRAYLLVNGATVGIQAAILTACKPGESVILPRNAHRAVWSALALGDVRPIWLPVEEHNGLATGITPEQLEKMLVAYPDAGAVFLVNPSFYGVLPNLAELLTVAARHNVTTIVDEAHGAHFAFVAPELSAVRLGADLVIDSWHKSMGSLGQTAVLLNNREDLRPERWLTLLQTTSPSYPLMASLDLARAEWERDGAARAGHIWQNRERLEEALDGRVLTLCGADDVPSGFGFDRTKVLLQSRAGHSGWQVAEALRTAGVEPEFADGRFALLLLTYADDGEKLAAALLGADEILTGMEPVAAEYAPTLRLPYAALTPFLAAHSGVERVTPDEAVGRISAALLVPYPPGIAVVGPGEVISAEAVSYLQAFAGEVQGIACDGTVEVCIPGWKKPQR